MASAHSIIHQQPYANESLNKIYQLLFCDYLEAFRPDSEQLNVYPWNILFQENPDESSLMQLAADPGLETRLQLLAQGRLRNAGVAFPEKELMAVIIEVGMDNGLDTLAAYKDGTARYINHSGRIVIWDAESTQSQALIGSLFEEGRKVVSRIGPWDKERLPAPGQGMIRLSFLVSDGLYFGQGPFNQLAKDPMAAPVIAAATDLMMFLINQDTK